MRLRNKSFSQILTASIFLIFVILLITTYLLTYNVFSKNIKSSSDKQIQETSNQLVYNFESYVSNIIQVSEIIQSSMQNDSTANHSQSKSLIKTLLLMKPEILSIDIYNEYGNSIINPNSPNVKNQSWFNEAKEEPSLHFFSPINPTDEKYLVHFSKAIPVTKDNEKAILRMDIDFAEIINLGYKTDLGHNGHILIIDDEYNLIYSSTIRYVENELDLLKGLVLGLSSYEIDGDEFTVSLTTIANSRWRLAMFYNTNDVSSTINNFLLILLTLEIAVFIIGTIIIAIVSRQLTAPLKNLQDAMLNTDFAGKNHKILPPHGTKEIYTLAESYNNMTEQIEHLMTRVIEEQKNQRKSELKALQNQINPHFLYNTLDSIVWMIDMDQKTDAQNMIIALAKLFRISISRGNSIIPVKDEIEHVKNYLYIQSMRYKDAFSFTINVDSECYKYKVMKLILQPIVENSIYHGLKNRVDAGLIEIEGHMDGSNLILSITDNGYGMSKEKIEDLYDKFNNPDLNDGVGLKNVYQRLRLYYGEKSYLKIFSEEDEYTKIVISIPVEVMENEA